MSTVAKAVHRGADGSVHYLMSTAASALLVITDPALGVRRIPFDGPCRVVPRDSKSDAVHYESISATGSTRVAVWPGQEPAISDYGFCVYCAFPAPGRVGAGHDSELWPSCPSHGRRKGRDTEPVDHGTVHILDRWDVDGTVVLITKHQCHDAVMLGLVVIDPSTGEVL